MGSVGQYRLRSLITLVAKNIQVVSQVFRLSKDTSPVRISYLYCRELFSNVQEGSLNLRNLQVKLTF